MNTLHTISQCLSSADELRLTLRYCADNDAVLLIQDAVLMASQPRFVEALNQVRLYVLADDLIARGVNCHSALNCSQIDYNQFVQLTLDNNQQIAW